MPNEEAYVMGSVSLIDKKLNGRYENIDEKKRNEKLESIGLNCCGIVGRSGGELSDDSVERAHVRSS
jgi:hypothetical protein